MELFQNLQQTVSRLKDVNWKTVTKPELEQLAQSLDVDYPAKEKRDPLCQRLRDRYELALSSLQQFSPKSKSPAAISPTTANDELSHAPVPTMAALDETVPPQMLATPEAVSSAAPMVKPTAEESTPAPPPPSAEPRLDSYIAIQDLKRQLTDTKNDILSLRAAYMEHVHQTAEHAENIRLRIAHVENEQTTLDITTAELQTSTADLQQKFQELKADCHHDLASLRRDAHRAERLSRADNVQIAQQGPQGGGDDDGALLALKMAGKSPATPHFDKIGLDTKLTRVGTVQAAFTALDAELESWKGTVYGLDRAHHRPLCNLLRSRLPPDLISALRYDDLEAAPKLQVADTYAVFKDALLQVVIQLDIGTSSHLDYIQKQRQGPRTVIQHVTALRALTDTIPIEVQHNPDFRRALFNTFNFNVKQHLDHLNVDWKTKNRYPDADTLYRAACAAHRFYGSDDEADIGEIQSSPTTSRVMAIQTAPARLWNIDQQLLHDLYPDSRECGPDIALDPEPCFQQQEYLCGALMEVNKMDITHAPDLQLCLRKVAKWLDALANGTWPARGFQNATYRAAHNVQDKVARQQQGLCWNCGEPGHVKAQCTKPHKRLTDHR